MLLSWKGWHPCIWNEENLEGKKITQILEAVVKLTGQGGVDDKRIKRKIDRDVNLIVVTLIYETDALLTFGVYKIEICGIGEASDCFAWSTIKFFKTTHRNVAILVGVIIKLAIKWTLLYLLFTSNESLQVYFFMFQILILRKFLLFFVSTKNE
jgi:hypothetical protein